MKIELNIPAIGNNPGTVGWLAAGLKSGAINLNEGQTKNGRHGLWLNGPNELKQCLALYDYYNLGNAAGFDAPKYQTIEDAGAEPESRDGLWSDAAWESLMQAAREWADEMNSARESENPIEIQIIRLETMASAA